MINWERVEELKTDVGEEEFPEVVELFLDEVDEVIGRLRDTAKAGPRAEVSEEDMHFLKGSALNLGLDAFAGLCSQAEKAAAAAGGRAPVDLGAILDAYAASRNALLGGRAAA